MIQLSLPFQDATWKEINKDLIDVKVLVLYPYYVEADANGNSFNITKDDIRSLHDNYNKTVKFKWSKLKKMGRDIPLKLVEVAPNHIDHNSDSVLTIVGHVIGEMEIQEKDDDPYLFATIRVKGKDNVERVQDGRFSQVSIGFDPVMHEVHEISWVVRGAIPGAQRVLSQGDVKIITSSKSHSLEYNTTNVTNVKSILLSQYENKRKLIEEKENESEISIMLTKLMADGKILPKDKQRLRIELKRIPDKDARFSAFNLLSNNLRNVVDYSIRSRNHLSLSLGDGLMSKKDGTLDLSKIAISSAILLKKGDKKARFEKEEEEKDEEKEMKKFSKKDLEHCISLAEDKEELNKYLSAFLSDEEDKEEKKEKEEEKEKANFSKEIIDQKNEIVELKKQCSEILEQVALLSKGTEEARALFSKIVELQNTSKEGK